MYGLYLRASTADAMIGGEEPISGAWNSRPILGAERVCPLHKFFLSFLARLRSPHKSPHYYVAVMLEGIQDLYSLDPQNTEKLKPL